MQDAPLPTPTSEHESCDAEKAAARDPKSTESMAVPFPLRDLTSEEAVCPSSPSIVAQLRFGTTEMSANRLPLASGEVIPLTESVAAPIELIVDGHVVARGDLVAHDGRAGIRITQVDRPCRDQFLCMEGADAA